MSNSSGIGSSTSSINNAGFRKGRVSPLRQRFIEHLILQQKAPRTVQSYSAWVYDLAKFHKRSPDQLGQPEIRSWILHLITERNLSASSINLAINALRAFYHGMLGADIEPYFTGIKRPARKLQPPRVFSIEEIEQLVTVGTEGDPFARVFLMTVFGCGLRLSEATHVQITDIDAPRMQLRVSHPKGGRQRVTILSPVLLQELRQWYGVHRPARWIFSQGPDQDPISKGTAQNIFYRAQRRSGIKKKLGIHALRHSFATLLLESGVEITVVQKLLGHAQHSHHGALPPCTPGTDCTDPQSARPPGPQTPLMRAPRCGAPGSGPSVGAVLRRFLPAFSGPLAPHTRQVLRRLSRCHTGHLGWTLWQCDVCSVTHWRPQGCGDRHCPECTVRAREVWLDRQQAALLPVRYYHWVFTLPAVLRPLALQNPRALYTLLFDAASSTLLQFGAERLGARLGITALLHTWGQNLMDHPHLHCLVTGGGLTTDEPPQWRGPPQAQYLFPVRAVGALFAGKFLSGLEGLRSRGELVLEGRLTPWRDPAVWQRTLGGSRC